MSKKHLLISGVLTLAFLAPVTKAHAQGYPTFDVAKLAGLISHFAGRLQPIPAIVQRVKQVVDIQGQVRAKASGMMSGGLANMAKDKIGSLKSDAFTKGKSPVMDAGENGSDAASKKAADAFFYKVKGKRGSNDEVEAVSKARRDALAQATGQITAKSIYMAMNLPTNLEDQLKTIKEADEKAESLHDKVNANTMAVMIRGVNRLEQISFLTMQMEKQVVTNLTTMPPEGYVKPVAPSVDTSEKDEIDVDLE